MVEGRPRRAPRAIPAGRVLRMPIAHAEGRYCAPDGRARARGPRGRSATAHAAGATNPNGSLRNIAGIVQRGRQRGRPDAAPRARVDELVGGHADGRMLFESLRMAAEGARVSSPDAGDRCPRVDDAVAHGLTRDEFDARSCEMLGREPSQAELGIFSVMWSEHCSYKSSRCTCATCPPTGRA